jgi:hypothetical protein
MLRIHVYGRTLFAARESGRWRLSLGGAEGKRRPLAGIVVPDWVVSVDDLLRFLQDLYHESARPGRDTVVVTEVHPKADAHERGGDPAAGAGD